MKPISFEWDICHISFQNSRKSQMRLWPGYKFILNSVLTFCQRTKSDKMNNFQIVDFPRFIRFCNESSHHKFPSFISPLATIRNVYKWWNEALDRLTSCKDCLIKWRKEFLDKDTKQIMHATMLNKFGLWGCIMGGVIASKIAQYVDATMFGWRQGSFHLRLKFSKALFIFQGIYCRMTLNCVRKRVCLQRFCSNVSIRNRCHIPSTTTIIRRMMSTVVISCCPACISTTTRIVSTCAIQ